MTDVSSLLRRTGSNVILAANKYFDTPKCLVGSNSITHAIYKEGYVLACDNQGTFYMSEEPRLRLEENSDMMIRTEFKNLEGHVIPTPTVASIIGNTRILLVTTRV
jgi:hypothetical protein